MIVSINQPAYLPWLGYFHRIAVSDVHIVLDHVQFEKNSFVNRNKIRTSNGWTWLTVPVLTKGRFGDLPIATLEVDPASGWSHKHWETLRQCYGRTPYFGDHEAFFRGVFCRPWARLAELCREVTDYLLDAFDIRTRRVSSIDLSPTAAKSDLVLELCRSVGATRYLSGALGRNYLDEERFREAGIEVEYQDYHHPVYPQRFAPFEPYMAAVDLLFNCGPKSRSYLLRAPENAP